MGGVSGLILAGGRSTRMGRDKASLEVGGRRLLEWQVDRMRGAGVGPVWISVGPDGHPAEGWPGLTGVGWVPDPESDGGPMTGIGAVLDRVGTEWLLVMAVDLPGMTSGFLGGLLGQRRRDAGRETGVVPMTDRGMEPLCAVIPVRLGRRALKEWLEEGKGRSPARWLGEGLERGWMTAWPVGSARELVNWNVPGDWWGEEESPASGSAFPGPLATNENE